MKKNLQISSDPTGRKSRVEFDIENLTISRQAELLGVNQSRLYREPPKGRAVSDENLFLMNRIDELHTAHKDILQGRGFSNPGLD